MLQLVVVGGLWMEKEEWYLEYEIQSNRPGLLGGYFFTIRNDVH